MDRQTHSKSTGAKKKGRRMLKIDPSSLGGDSDDAERPEMDVVSFSKGEEKVDELESVAPAVTDAQDKAEDQDDGPEQVLLVQGKDEALERKRLENAAVKRVKLSMKEKRRLKAEMFRKQKEARQLKTPTKFPESALDKALSKIADQKAEKMAKEKPKSPSPEPAATAPTQIGSVKVVVITGSSEMADDASSSDVGSEHAHKEHLQSSSLKTVPGSQFPRKCPRKPAANFVTQR